MRVIGTISYAGELRSGVSAKGQWKARDFALSSDMDTILFSVFGDKLDTYRLEVGNKVDANIGFRVREYNGRRYMDASLISCSVVTDGVALQPTPTQPTPTQPTNQQPVNGSLDFGTGNGLPF